MMEEKRILHIPRERFPDLLERKIYTMFPGGRRKVFTLSYDDSQTCDRPLVEMMRKYGVKGTFNVCSAQIVDDMPHQLRPWRSMTMEECVELYGDDMEMAIHGAHHPYWGRMPSAQAMVDALEDRRNIERATGKIIRGAVYPYGSYTEDVKQILKECGVSEKHVSKFSVEYDEAFGFEADLHPKNIIDNKRFEIKTPDVSIKVAPDRADLIETRVIGGVKYILICADENVEVNGVNIHIHDKETAAV